MAIAEDKILYKFQGLFYVKKEFERLYLEPNFKTKNKGIKSAIRWTSLGINILKLTVHALGAVLASTIPWDGIAWYKP